MLCLLQERKRERERELSHVTVTGKRGSRVCGRERGSRVSDVGKRVAELVMAKGIAELVT